MKISIDIALWKDRTYDLPKELIPEFTQILFSLRGAAIVNTNTVTASFGANNTALLARCFDSTDSDWTYPDVERAIKANNGRKKNSLKKQVDNKLNQVDNKLFLNSTIKQREDTFKQELWKTFQGVQKVDVIKEFFEYWSEHGANDKKMRFEKEKSFDVTKRMVRWTKPKGNQPKKHTIDINERHEE